MVKCHAYISYKDSLVQLENIAGISNNIILFNPIKVGDKLDYKLQLADRILLKQNNIEKLIPILEMGEDFCIINSMDEEIFNIDKPNEDFVNLVLQRIELGIRGTLELN